MFVGAVDAGSGVSLGWVEVLGRVGLRMRQEDDADEVEEADEESHVG